MNLNEPALLTAPVTTLFAALETRDRELVSAALSDDVRLEVPSLSVSCTGVDDVLAAMGAVLVAFPDFRYRVRSRYVEPETVTDEAMLQGTWTGPLLDSPPTGRAGTVPARVLIGHDGRVVTAITVWADGGALHELVDLPGPLPPTASPLVSQLRAALLTGEGRVILAHEREPAGPAAPAPAPRPATATPRPAAPSGRRPRRVPIPRKVRRLQAAVLALLMVGASSLLVAWMVSGTVRTASVQPARHAVVAPRPAPPASVPGPDPTSSNGIEAPVELRFDPGRNEFELSTDALFFDTDSSQLTPAAQNAIDRVAEQIRAEHRIGRITVTGYTDQRGSAGYNQALSRRRADAVATALGRALGTPATKVTVTAVGKGEADPLVTTGASAQELAPNRRVTIQVPKPS